MENVKFQPRTTSLQPDKPSQPILSTILNLFSPPEQVNVDINKLVKNHQTLMDKIDSSAYKLTLASLESENMKLSFDSRAIIANAGTFTVSRETLDQLSTPIALQTDDDLKFWESVCNDYSSIVSKIPDLLISRIRSGIPSELRTKIWILMCDAKPDRIALLYPGLLNDESQFDRIIKRDLPRTFPKVEMFMDPNGQGQIQLYNLLKAYSNYDTEVGYCQGLSFIVGPLLLQDMTEIEAFSILVKLMQEDHPINLSFKPYALKSLFTPNMIGLHFMLYAHTELLKTLIPKVFSHFESLGINSSMFAAQWFLTLFSYNFPFPLVYRIFDIIFAEGALITMLRFSISLLKTNQETILELLEFEEILNFLKGASLFQVYNSNHEHAVKDAMAEAEFISPSCFEKLQKEFELQFGNNQLNGMRLLVSQLRSDSQKMVKTLNDMSLRNNYLEKEYREKDVYRKGSELEILGLRREVEKLKRNLGELMIEKDALIKENESLRLQGDLGSLSV